MKNLNGKVVALTGAASGIGRSLAIKLADQGSLLAISDIDRQGLDETLSLLPSGSAVRSDIVNVANREEVYDWAKRVVDHFGHVDCIINNAGVASAMSIEDISYDVFEWVFNIDFYGVLYGTKAFLPYLKQRPEAHVVNISSVNAFFPFPKNGPYNCAKHAVKALNQTLQQELRKTSINVTSVHPGGIKTNIVSNSIFSDDDSSSDMAQDRIDKFANIALTTPERAADKIIKGIKKNRKRQLVGIDAVVIDLLCRLMPQSFSTFIGLALEDKESKA
jgi:NAD(P)-dependent dehydrogenase (short-subunit alcohol dehydrogenase family)